MKRFNPRTLSLLALCTISLNSCGDHNSQQNTNTGGIIGGTEVSADDATEIGQSTVSLLTFSGFGISGCSGTLVNDHYILTARHCFTGDLSDTTPVSEYNNYKVIFSTKSVSFNQLGKSSEYLSAFLNENEKVSFAFDNSAVSYSNKHDIALVDLSKVRNFVVPNGYKSAKIYSGDELPVGTQVKMAGFGVRSDNISSESTSLPGYGFQYGALYVVNGSVSGYGFKDADMKKSLEDLANNGDKFDPKTTDQILVKGNGSTGTCHGDSGGPTYVLSQGHYEVVGVTSWGLPLFDAQGNDIEGSCDTKQADRQVYVSAPNVKTWLDSVLYKR